jgi:hypothetical protein
LSQWLGGSADHLSAGLSYHPIASRRSEDVDREYAIVDNVMRDKNEEADLFRVGLSVDIEAPRVGARIHRGITEWNSRIRPV